MNPGLPAIDVEKEAFHHDDQWVWMELSREEDHRQKEDLLSKLPSLHK